MSKKTMEYLINNESRGKRDRIISIRLSETEKRIFEDEAKRLHKRLPKFIRERLLQSIFHKEDEVRDMAKVSAQAIDYYITEELDRIADTISEKVILEDTIISMHKTLAKIL